MKTLNLNSANTTIQLVNQVPVGSVIKYKSSDKLYIVTTGINGGRRIYSTTQVFNASKPYPVEVLVKGTGVLPTSFEDSALNTLLRKAKKDLKAVA